MKRKTCSWEFAAKSTGKGGEIDGQKKWEPCKWFQSWFPLGLEIRENLEKWEGIFQSGKSQGILSRLEKSGNFAQNTGKTGKFE